jgi:hypothetical protein
MKASTARHADDIAKMSRRDSRKKRLSVGNAYLKMRKGLTGLTSPARKTL